jgi:putative ATP-binding cassette transporter
MSKAGRRAWRYFVQVAIPYFTSEARRRGFVLLGVLVGLLLAMSALNVANSYVGRDFMTALAGCRPERYFALALAYLGVFAASSVVGAFQRYVELLLGLHWREWLTRWFVARFLAGQAYFRLNDQSHVDNPDQRISEDVKTFTTTSLSLLIMLLNSAITVIAFAGVLWSITPWLVLAVVLYPVLGTSLIVLVGRRLVPLNNLQLQKEADFRFALVHVRQNAESVALVHDEPKEQARLLDRLGKLVANYRDIITVTRNVKLLTGGYNYLTQLIPVLIVAPRYLRGEVDFGVITQSSMAFALVFNAFSLVVEQFQSLSEFAAVVGRLGTLHEALGEAGRPSPGGVRVAEADDHVAYDGVTLRTPRDGRVLVRDLSLEVPKGRRVLVSGPNGAGKTALVRATAGLWRKGTGRIVCPGRDRVCFLPQHPYMVPGTLRDQLVCAAPGGRVPEERIKEVLHELHLEPLVRRLGGLDVEANWRDVLSLGEQQLVAFARLLLAEPACCRGRRSPTSARPATTRAWRSTTTCCWSWARTAAGRPSRSRRRRAAVEGSDARRHARRPQIPTAELFRKPAPG